MPQLNKVAEENEVKIYYVDTDVEDISEVSEKYNIEYVPDLLYFENSELVDKTSYDSYSKVDGSSYSELYRNLYDMFFENNVK